MTVAEWSMWRAYHGKFGLPYRRLELHLAQIALVLAVTSGKYAPETQLSNFLIDPVDDTEPEDADDDDDEEGIDAFGDMPVDAIRDE